MVISIHAPLAGSDHLCLRSECSPKQFQSTLPSQGATDVTPRTRAIDTVFQSTLPSQGATLEMHSKYYGITISIHAPLAGSDNSPRCLCLHRLDFNPRSPRRERQQMCPTNLYAHLHFCEDFYSWDNLLKSHLTFFLETPLLS